DRAAALVAELAGGKPASSTDVYPGPLKQPRIEVSAGRIERVLGVTVQPPEAASILEHLHFSVARSDSVLRVTPPDFRLDCAIPENRDALRRSLLPGLLEALAFNARQDQPGARLFELGPGFWKKTTDAVDEPRLLAIAIHIPSGASDAAAAELRALQATVATV